MTPRYEPRQTNANATITWHSHALVTTNSNSTLSSAAGDKKASSNATLALRFCA